MPSLQQIIQALWTNSVGTAIGALAGAGLYLGVFRPDPEPCISTIIRDCPPAPTLDIPELAGLVALGMLAGFIVERIFFNRA